MQSFINYVFIRTKLLFIQLTNLFHSLVWLLIVVIFRSNISKNFYHKINTFIFFYRNDYNKNDVEQKIRMGNVQDYPSILIRHTQKTDLNLWLERTFNTIPNVTTHNARHNRLLISRFEIYKGVSALWGLTGMFWNAGAIWHYYTLTLLT